MFFADRFRTPLSITFAFVATHNHFVLDRGGKVFNRTAPVIKLPPETGEDAHLGLLGLLNASVACFWMKQVFQDKGGWRHWWRHARTMGVARYEHDSTKLLQFPIPTPADPTLIAFARHLDTIAAARVADTVALAIDTAAAQDHTALTAALAARRDRDLSRFRQMVALQEELDWYAYGLYGIAADLPRIPPADVAELVPGNRSFEIILARHNLDIRETLARGEDPGEQPTAWFARHGWEPVTEVANIPDLRYRAIVERRLDLIAQNPSLALLEQPTYKRRWFKPDHAAQEAAALDGWLADRLEDWAREQPAPWPMQRAAAALETDAAVQAVAQELAGRRDYELEAILRRLVVEAAVPNCKTDRYSAAGLEKRAAWEHTWALQHAQDRGEDVTVPVPPRYGSTDFAKPSIWRLRGKLDVPKERFIAFTEMPGATGDRALYGWAGWNPRQRARILLALDDQAEAAGAPLPGRYGLLWGVWFLLPWVAWEAEAAAAEFRGIVQDLVGRAGVTEAMLGEWAAGRKGGRRG
ncbi:MAG: BREX-2 system adenine-specific DNA-methyltransferase PglX [Ardenticatenia bacterium]|nr:BREX-2 system adenine-specific DNA-methyltransferase PglX [Ardenticatenia bacterium]